MIRLTESLTVANAKSVLEAGLRAIAAGEMTFDLGGLTMVDSAAVATLLAWQRAARGKNLAVAFSNPPAALQSLARLYGVADLLHLTHSTAPADLRHH
jgi:phospholipid transport system transporter-binding protein